MTTLLNLKYKFAAFDDPTTSLGVPYGYYFNWDKALSAIEVTNPQMTPYVVNPGATKTVFNGFVSTGIDGTTTFSVGKNSAIESTYRFTKTSGTSPAFRTNRSLTLNTYNITITVGTDGTATFTTSAGSLAALQVGDTLFIPGLTTGDTAGPFNAQNEGAWVVLTTGTLTVTVGRISSTFSGYTETVALTSNAQVLGFSAAGVQIGNTVDLVSGFSAASLGTYVVNQVTPDWVEVFSTVAIAAQTGVVPTATGMVFYDSLKTWVHIETDQNCVVRFNGDTGDTNRLTPVVVNGKNIAYLEKMGAVYSLVVVNKSPTTPLNLLVFSVE